MLVRIGVVLLVLALVPLTFADEVVLRDGTVLNGRVQHVEVEGHGVVARDKVNAIRLGMDRGALDSQWIERLLRFALARARDGVRTNGRVGVYMGRGVSAPSALAVVRRLDAAKQAPRLLFESDMTTKSFSKMRVLVMPGGWAPSQLAGLGSAGQAAIARFVYEGGGYLGICAGGYVPCSTVVWDGVSISYPLKLVPGSAIGPVKGLAPWPKSQAIRLALSAGKHADALYAGGAHYDVPDAAVHARYPDGQAAAVEVTHGRGRLLLIGAHVEFHGVSDADLLQGWATGVASGDARLFGRLLKRVAR